MRKPAQLDLRDSTAIKEGLLQYLHHKHRFKALLHRKKKKKFHDLKDFQIIGYDGQYIDYQFKILLQQESLISSTDFYFLSIYIENSNHELLQADKEHIQEINLLKIYPGGHRVN